MGFDPSGIDAWLDVIDEMNGWVSPRLGIRFELSSDTLVLYRPDGQPYADYVQVQQQLEAAENRATLGLKALSGVCGHSSIGGFSAFSA